jgi:hypothetical protein
MKTLSLAGTDIKITVPETAPEFFEWQTQSLGSKKFANGNVIGVFESLSPDLTVDVIMVVAMINEKGSIICLQICYCPEGFNKFNDKIEHVTDCFEDAVFVKTGKQTGILERVKKLTPYENFSNYIEGRDT